MKDQVIICYYNTLNEKGCFDFLRPTVCRDVKDILALYREGRREFPDSLTPVAPSAAEDLEDMLLERLNVLYVGILIGRLNRLIRKYDYSQAITPPEEPTDELRKAAEDLKQEQNSREDALMLSEYPMLPGYLDRIRENYKNHILELLSRFHDCTGELTDRFFSGKRPERITGLKSSGADMHRKGRCVVHVITDAGDCYYKPHDCGLDEFYQRITVQWFSDCTLAPEVIRKDGYAFVSALVRKGLKVREEAGLYYYHFGILTALLHGIGSNDMHAENVLPCGNLPCIVDMESVVSTRRKQKETAGEDDWESRDLFESIGTSVLHTGLLPARLHKGGIFSPFYRCEISANALPFFGDASYTIEGYEQEFIRGFREGYQRMLLHREEILGLLSLYTDVMVRMIPFNTMYYARCRARLYTPEALRSGQVTEKMLSDLAIAFTWYGKEPNRDQIRYEAAALQEGDIPYFCTAMCSHDLYGKNTDELVQKDFLSISAMEYTVQSLKRLSEQDLVFEEEVIKQSFVHVPMDVPTSQEEQLWPAAAEIPEHRESTLIPDILHKSISERIYMTNMRPVWLSHAATTRKQAGVLAQLAGAVIYSCRILLCPEYSALFREAGQFLTESLEDMEKHMQWLLRMETQMLKTQISAGLGAGLGQVLYSLGVVLTMNRSEALSAGLEEKAKPLARKLRNTLLELLMEKEIWDIENTDLQEGLAGLILGVLAGEPKSCSSREDDDKANAVHTIISRSAARLLQPRECEEADAFTGDAGIGSALAKACWYTGTAGYAKGAADVFSRVKEQYSRTREGWLESGSVMKWAAKRAPKAAGIGLCALETLKVLDLPEHRRVIREVLELALHSLLHEEQLYWNDSLYRGNALSVLFLERAGAYLQRPELTKRAGQILFSMEKRSEAYGYFHLMEKGVRNCFDISFLEGSLGIGYAAMEVRTL